MMLQPAIVTGAASVLPASTVAPADTGEFAALLAATTLDLAPPTGDTPLSVASPPVSTGEVAVPVVSLVETPAVALPGFIPISTVAVPISADAPVSTTPMPDVALDPVDVAPFALTALPLPDVATTPAATAQPVPPVPPVPVIAGKSEVITLPVTPEAPRRAPRIIPRAEEATAAAPLALDIPKPATRAPAAKRATTELAAATLRTPLPEQGASVLQILTPPQSSPAASLALPPATAMRLFDHALASVADTQWLDSVTDGIAAVAKGAGDLRIRMDSEALGPLTVAMALSDPVTKIRIAVADERTRDAIEDRAANTAATAAALGAPVSAIAVEVDRQRQQQRGGARFARTRIEADAATPEPVRRTDRHRYA